MTQPTYAPAREAADGIHRHFACHPGSADIQKETLPDADTMAAMIDAAFWTSLRREEIYTPRISLALVTLEQAPYPISFAAPISLTARDLTRLAAAVERSGIHLCVSRASDELHVWGIARSLPSLCLVVEIVAPGLLVVKRSPHTESGKFLNIAVLQGDEIKIIDPQAVHAMDPPSPQPLSRRLEVEFASSPAVNVLLQLAVSIRAHGRGGMLLVVPGSSEAWKESILHPIAYEVKPFAGLAELMRKSGNGPISRKWEDATARAVDGIAGLTAVDGATVITSEYDLLAFGAKIVRRTRAPHAPQVIVTEPVAGATPMIAAPSELGGTRHIAAAQFVHDQRDATALVASQDGRFTVFGWSPADEMVHAHRIDVLLL